MNRLINLLNTDLIDAIRNKNKDLLYPICEQIGYNWLSLWEHLNYGYKNVVFHKCIHNGYYNHRPCSFDFEMGIHIIDSQTIEVHQKICVCYYELPEIGHKMWELLFYEVKTSVYP